MRSPAFFSVFHISCLLADSIRASSCKVLVLKWFGCAGTNRWNFAGRDGLCTKSWCIFCVVTPSRLGSRLERYLIFVPNRKLSISVHSSSSYHLISFEDYLSIFRKV